MAASDPQAMVDAEQLFHDLEQRYVRLREEHGRISSERDTLRDANASLEATVSSTRRQLLEAARVRNLSFTLREKSQKKFDFGFVAEEKEDA